jgi:hypothetical protein
MNKFEKEECPGCRAATVANHNVSERISDAFYRWDHAFLSRSDLGYLMRFLVDAMIPPNCKAHDPRFPVYHQAWRVA